MISIGSGQLRISTIREEPRSLGQRSDPCQIFEQGVWSLSKPFSVYQGQKWPTSSGTETTGGTRSASRYPSTTGDAGVESGLRQTGGDRRNDVTGVQAFGLRKCRYLGLAKTRLQHVATAAAINIDRLAAWLDGRPHANTRVSRFTALCA